ncbi:MAG: HAD family hydrolase [Campylobacterota bacterium]|nr:HAD family hydrolase [Campylobacterota bacterium]
MQTKQLIIFDMDGTLIDSGDVIANTINYVRSNIGLTNIPKDEMLYQINNPDINAAEFFYGTKEFTKEQTILFSEYYNKNCIKDITLYDGIKNMLENINGEFQLSIATNASVEFANKMIKHLEIDKYFDLVIGANDVKNPKPHPDMIFKTLERLEKQSQYSLLVGDSHKDLQAANSADVDNILVNWGFTKHQNDANVILNADELTNRLLSYK